jgi:hypothetical protein
MSTMRSTYEAKASRVVRSSAPGFRTTRNKVVHQQLQPPLPIRLNAAPSNLGRPCSKRILHGWLNGCQAGSIVRVPTSNARWWPHCGHGRRRMTDKSAFFQSFRRKNATVLLASRKYETPQKIFDFFGRGLPWIWTIARHVIPGRVSARNAVGTSETDADDGYESRSI